jgi:hypothetical protein
MGMTAISSLIPLPPVSSHRELRSTQIDRTDESSKSGDESESSQDNAPDKGSAEESTPAPSETDLALREAESESASFVAMYSLRLLTCESGPATARLPAVVPFQTGSYWKTGHALEVARQRSRG